MLLTWFYKYCGQKLPGLHFCCLTEVLLSLSFFISSAETVAPPSPPGILKENIWYSTTEWSVSWPGGQRTAGKPQILADSWLFLCGYITDNLEVTVLGHRGSLLVVIGRFVLIQKVHTQRLWLTYLFLSKHATPSAKVNTPILHKPASALFDLSWSAFCEPRDLNMSVEIYTWYMKNVHVTAEHCYRDMVDRLLLLVVVGVRCSCSNPVLTAMWPSVDCETLLVSHL